MKIDLSTKDGFAVASAMRGPDLPGYDESSSFFRLKEELTGRLRFLVGAEVGAPQGCIITDTPVGEMDVEAMKVGLRALVLGPARPGVKHYIHHIARAAEALARLASGEIYLEANSLAYVARDLENAMYEGSA